MEPETVAPVSEGTVSFADAVRVWARVAALSFGGPAGQIAVMHRILVEEKGWISESRFLHALNYCMLLPGPEAMQLATYIGWLLHGVRGGLVAGWLFVLPGFVSILGLSVLYAAFQNAIAVEAIFFGIKAAVLAIIVEALRRIGKRALRTRPMLWVAAAAFVAIFVFDIPFPLIIIVAALIGFVGGRLNPDRFLEEARRREPASDAASQGEADRTGHAQTPPTWRSTALTGALWLTVWLAPVLALLILLGPEHVLAQLALFFSKLAVVTFGGAYAVLAYMAQEAVQSYAWLAPGEMLDGLGMAETTPGPLIQVVQFVGYLAGYREAGAVDPLLLGVAASIVVTWVTFAPCFLWIFLGAPFVERLREARLLTSALSAVTAAVVGVILNLVIWFALHVLFADVDEVKSFGARLLVPDWSTLDVAAVVIAAAALVALLRFKVPMPVVLLVSALAGAGWYVVVAS